MVKKRMILLGILIYVIFIISSTSVFSYLLDIYPQQTGVACDCTHGRCADEGSRTNKGYSNCLIASSDTSFYCTNTLYGHGQGGLWSGGGTCGGSTCCRNPTTKFTNPTCDTSICDPLPTTYWSCGSNGLCSISYSGGYSSYSDCDAICDDDPPPNPIIPANPSTCPPPRIICETGQCLTELQCHCAVWCAKGGAPGCDCGSIPSTPSTPSCTYSCGSWSSCGGFSSECDSSGSKSQSCTCPTSTNTAGCRRVTENKMCQADEGICKSDDCVDCDRDEYICSLCKGDYIPSELGNHRCCGNTPREIKKDNEIQFGNVACCDQATDCAVDIQTCVNSLDSDYDNAAMITDSICIDGSLISRTKMVAMQLLTMAKNNPDYNDRYVLFCGDKTESLNKISKDGTDISNVNSICVMSYKNQNGLDDQVIIGTALNQGSNFIGLVNIAEACNDVIEGVNIAEAEMNQFHQCGGYENIYYNPTANAVIFSSKPLLYVNEPHWLVSLFEYLTDLINTLFETEFGQNHEINFLDERDERYTEIYINKIGSKAIRSIKEPRLEQYNEVEVVIASYSGFTSTVCEDQEEIGGTMRGMIKKPRGLAEEDFNCTKISANEHFVFMKNESFSYGWSDLTAKLRPVYS